LIVSYKAQKSSAVGSSNMVGCMRSQCCKILLFQDHLCSKNGFLVAFYRPLTATATLKAQDVERKAQKTKIAENWSLIQKGRYQA